MKVNTAAITRRFAIVKLRPLVSDLLKPITLANLHGKIIGIDGYIQIYSFLASVRGISEGGGLLTDDSGNVTSHLVGVLSRTLAMLEAEIKPVYVFDGAPPSFKQKEISTRERTKEEAEEIEEAEEEGIIIHPCLGIRRILAEDGIVVGIETIACVSVYDEDGTFAPKFKEGTTPTMEVDNVIIAIGQKVDKSMLPSGLLYSTTGTVSVDPVTLETNIKGVFAGGDVVTGAETVISAMGAGKRAAADIDTYLKGE